MNSIYFPSNGPQIKFCGLKFYSKNGRVAQWLIGRFVLFFYLLVTVKVAQAQTKQDSVYTPFKFSGTLILSTNGISPIPAFSLDKPAVLVNLSLRKRRFSFNPEMSFSTKGIPWYLNNFFRYRLIEKKRFQFQTGLIWGIGYSYPKVIQNGISRTIAKAERFLWLELVPKYKISEKVAISSTTFSGYNFEPGSVKRINYISLIGNITKIKLHNFIYGSFFPQLFYLNIDNKSDGFFVAGVLGIGHNKLPLFLSAQVNQTLTTTITPDPGFKWNVSLSYSFK